MRDIEIRLECLRLAVATGAGLEAVAVAERLAAFVKGSPPEREERNEDQ